MYRIYRQDLSFHSYDFGACHFSQSRKTHSDSSSLLLELLYRYYMIRQKNLWCISFPFLTFFHWVYVIMKWVVCVYMCQIKIWCNSCPFLICRLRWRPLLTTVPSPKFEAFESAGGLKPVPWRRWARNWSGRHRRRLGALPVDGKISSPPPHRCSSSSRWSRRSPCPCH